MTSASNDHDGCPAGLLRRLSETCCASAQNAADAHDVAHVYDNINTVFKAAEQIIGWKDSIENGTCETAIRLFDASRDDMKTSDLLDSESGKTSESILRYVLYVLIIPTYTSPLHIHHIPLQGILYWYALVYCGMYSR